MTEDEAKTKWCPHVRIACGLIEEGGKVLPDLPTFNRVALPSGPAVFPKAATCVGSKCMAWRETSPVKASMDLGPSSGRLPATPARGYCGLSGKPENVS